MKHYRGICTWYLADDRSVFVRGEAEVSVSDTISLDAKWPGRERWRLTLRRNGAQWTSLPGSPRLALSLAGLCTVGRSWARPLVRPSILHK
jgi:hypothetical protein